MGYWAICVLQLFVNHAVTSLFILCKGLSMKQITQFFSEGESLTLNIVTLLFDID